MNNLLSFYEKIKQFAEDHNMINEFMLLGTPDELRSREFSYRTLVMIPASSNIGRDLSRPVYTLSFNCSILDKCAKEDEMSFVVSTEENIFVAGQLQDFLTQDDEYVSIDNVEVGSFYNQDENITAAYFELTATFARKNYNAGIDI